MLAAKARHATSSGRVDADGMVELRPRAQKRAREPPQPRVPPPNPERRWVFYGHSYNGFPAPPKESDSSEDDEPLSKRPAAAAPGHAPPPAPPPIQIANQVSFAPVQLRLHAHSTEPSEGLRIAPDCPEQLGELLIIGPNATAAAGHEHGYVSWMPSDRNVKFAPSWKLGLRRFRDLAWTNNAKCGRLGGWGGYRSQALLSYYSGNEPNDMEIMRIRLTFVRPKREDEIAALKQFVQWAQKALPKVEESIEPFREGPCDTVAAALAANEAARAAPAPEPAPAPAPTPAPTVSLEQLLDNLSKAKNFGSALAQSRVHEQLVFKSGNACGGSHARGLEPPRAGTKLNYLHGFAGALSLCKLANTQTGAIVNCLAWEPTGGPPLQSDPEKAHKANLIIDVRWIVEIKHQPNGAVGPFALRVVYLREGIYAVFDLIFNKSGFPCSAARLSEEARQDFLTAIRPHVNCPMPAPVRAGVPPQAEEIVRTPPAPAEHLRDEAATRLARIPTALAPPPQPREDTGDDAVGSSTNLGRSTFLGRCQLRAAERLAGNNVGSVVDEVFAHIETAPAPAPAPAPKRTETARIFQSADTFQGLRPGYVFKKGVHGLGYYKDAASVPVPAPAPVVKQEDAPPPPPVVAPPPKPKAPARSIPKKPKLVEKTHTLPLEGWLLPATHPFTPSEVVRARARYAQVVPGGGLPLTSESALCVLLDLVQLAVSYRKQVGCPCTYWLQNIEQELLQREWVPHDGERRDNQWRKGLLSAALLDYKLNVFAELNGDSIVNSRNRVVDRVALLVYNKGRLSNRTAVKRSETILRKWEAEHGEAWRAAEAAREHERLTKKARHLMSAAHARRPPAVLAANFLTCAKSIAEFEWSTPWNGPGLAKLNAAMSSEIHEFPSDQERWRWAHAHAVGLAKAATACIEKIDDFINAVTKNIAWLNREVTLSAPECNEINMLHHVIEKDKHFEHSEYLVPGGLVHDLVQWIAEASANITKLQNVRKEAEERLKVLQSRKKIMAEFVAYVVAQQDKSKSNLDRLLVDSLARASSDEDEVVFSHEKTWAERDAEARQAVVELD